MSAVHDLTGRRFGRLTVLRRAGSNRRGRAMWLCRCDCGAEKVVLGNKLLTGHTKSCGCYKAECSRKNNLKHGLFVGRNANDRPRLYRIWCGMRQRCNDPSSSSYHRYGGRGIYVCPEWERSFEAFRDWALANGYRDDLTLDRIDNDGPYSPENCRWATYREQAQNRARRGSHAAALA